MAATIDRLQPEAPTVNVCFREPYRCSRPADAGVVGLCGQVQTFGADCAKVPRHSGREALGSRHDKNYCPPIGRARRLRNLADQHRPGRRDGSALSIDACYEKAGEICGSAGYDIAKQHGSATPFFIAGSGGSFTAGSIVSRSVLVRCRALS